MRLKDRRDKNRTGVFDFESQSKFYKALEKVFSMNIIKDTQVKSEDLLNQYIMDMSNCIAIVPKTMEYAELLKVLTNTEEWNYRKVNANLTYIDNVNKPCCKYSVNMLILLLKIFESINVNPLVCVKEDFPMTLECDYFKIILAPIVSNE